MNSTTGEDDSSFLDSLWGTTATNFLESINWKDDFKIKTCTIKKALTLLPASKTLACANSLLEWRQEHSEYYWQIIGQDRDQD